MAVLYNYLKYKDIYTLTNTGANTLDYVVRKVECNVSTIIQSGTLLFGGGREQVLTLPFNVIDGIYSITLTDGDQEVVINNIIYYKNLLDKIIENAEYVLCECHKCDECKECVDCELNLVLLVQILSYYIMTKDQYQDKLTLVIDSVRCTVDDKILYSLMNKMIYGNEDVKHLYLQLVALFYVVFYSEDFSSAINEEDELYVTEKYNFTKVIKCINKLGINIQEEL